MEYIKIGNYQRQSACFESKSERWVLEVIENCSELRTEDYIEIVQKIKGNY